MYCFSEKRKKPDIGAQNVFVPPFVSRKVTSCLTEVMSYSVVVVFPSDVTPSGYLI